MRDVVKETKIIESMDGLDYAKAHVYNATKQRLVLVFESKPDGHVFIKIEGALAKIKEK